MFEEPSQPEANTVDISSRCPLAQGAVRASRDVVGDVRRTEGSTIAVGQMCIGGQRLGYHNLEEVAGGHLTWSNLELF